MKQGESGESQEDIHNEDRRPEGDQNEEWKTGGNKSNALTVGHVSVNIV